jgi:hypothetical protein
MSKLTPGGYLMIDHRQSPGISEEEAALTGAMPVGRGMLFQADTRRCGHCPRQIVLNPLRTRERGWCSKGDHYICDECNAVYAATGVCRPWQKVIDDFIDAGAKGKL